MVTTEAPEQNKLEGIASMRRGTLYEVARVRVPRDRRDEMQIAIEPAELPLETFARKLVDDSNVHRVEELIPSRDPSVLTGAALMTESVTKVEAVDGRLEETVPLMRRGAML